MTNKNLVVFQDKKIRRTLYNDELYFSVVDVVEVLTESPNPRNYWNMLKAREEENGIELYTICVQLKLKSSDEKKYSTDCANTKNMLRIIQSIPSPNAEPFKQWLAQVGYERIQEIEDPELAQKRMIKIYKAKGYSDEWIEKRIRGIQVRDELTKEWENRDVKEGKEFAILTNEISKVAFGKTVSEYKEFKHIEKQNLRDHMNQLELVFTMLGEVSTTHIAKGKDAQGFDENKVAAQEGGTVSSIARKELELKSGISVIDSGNYLREPEKIKKLAKNTR